MGIGSELECRLCAEDTYNSWFGQTGCRPCGQFAYSQEGSDSCECYGKYRTFSEVDVSCRCRSGYDYKDIDGKSLGDLSSIQDCAPLVFDRCDDDN